MIQWNQTTRQKSSITIQLLVLIPTVIPKLQLFKVEAQLRVTFFTLNLTVNFPIIILLLLVQKYIPYSSLSSRK